MAELSLANVVNISVSTPQQGVGAYSPNNLALFTNDAFGSSFGTAGFAIYLDPLAVATDFGTDSLTYELANQVFGQQPNILNGNGYLTVIPFLPAVETLTLSAAAATGSATVLYGSDSVIVPAAIWGSPAALQTALRTLDGLEQVSVAQGSTALIFNVTVYGYYGTPAAVTIGSNTLQTSGSVAVTVTPSITGSGETLAAAIVRTQGLVQYFGIMPDRTVDVLGSTDVLAAAAVVQTLNKIMLVAGDLTADIVPGGTLDLLRANAYTKSRALYYGGSSDTDALDFMAAYAGVALSTNFDGSDTTQTMHLKSLVGIVADNSLTQTLLDTAIAAGADTYPSLQGVAKVFTSGENSFYDQVYNLGWFVGALQVAGFNYLAEAQTKVPQTEQGMTGLKGAYRSVCVQAVNNGYLAPGSWTSATTFGNLLNFLQNILSAGYYIFSQPVSQQAAAQRAARVAPLVQLAAKEAGAIQKSNVIVLINP